MRSMGVGFVGNSWGIHWMKMEGMQMELWPRKTLSSEEYMNMKSTAYENFASTDDLLRDLLDICLMTVIPVLGVLASSRSSSRMLGGDFLGFALPVGLAFAAPKLALVPATAVLAAALLLGRNSGPDDKVESGAESCAFLRCTRASLSFLTTVCILAVDFPTIFPRSMAKTETYGLSLMDVGVGAVVLVSALNRRELTSVGNFPGFLVRTFPALVMGFGRFLFVKETDYFVPTGEYGVHWNFFVTLWVVAVIGEILKRSLSWTFARNRILTELSLAALGLALASLPSYIVEVRLSEWWFFFGDRTPTPSFPAFLAANREGIVSSLGFIALDLFGSALSRSIKTGDIRVLGCGLAASVAVFTGLLSHGAYPSRRMANIGFCVAVCVVTLWTLVCFRVALGRVTSGIPPFFSGILKRPLVFFLISNAVTGLVNILLQTLLFPAPGALLVMTVYIAVLWTLGKII